MLKLTVLLEPPPGSPVVEIIDTLKHEVRDEVTIMDIDYEKLAALFYVELQKTFVMKGRWRDCSETFQRVWEEAVRQALVRAASQEGDEYGAATLLLKRLSTPTSDRDTNIYTVAALVFEELINRYESGVAFFGLGMAWESRSEQAHEIWAVAVRRRWHGRPSPVKTLAATGTAFFFLVKRRIGQPKARPGPQAPSLRSRRSSRNRTARGGNSGGEQRRRT